MRWRAPTGDGEVQARRLAARFAAKEATMKAIGRGSDRLPAWRIDRGPPGRWRHVHTCGSVGKLRRSRRRARLSEFAVSLNEEGGLASAVVLALVNGET